MRKTLILALVITFIFQFIRIDSVVNAGNLSALLQAVTPGPEEKIQPRVKEELASLPPGEMLTVIVTMKEQVDVKQIPGAVRAARQQGVIQALQAKAHANQKQIRQYLAMRDIQGVVAQVIPFWVFNGLSVTATGDVIQELASRSDVAMISADQIEIVPSSPLGAGAPETNLSNINVPDLWSLSIYGQDVVVANMDSGVDISHPDLSSRWRGGSNSWFDPYGQHATPTDLLGHGTQTMGVMIAGDAGGTSIGVAPQAQWIAVKIFNDAGAATTSAIHLGYQWLLDPDNDPNTPDAPQVVNNSWTMGSPGCNLEFQLDLQALRAVGILPVFAAGNYGPYSATSVSPANYPQAFAVGAVDNSDLVYALSSRGPSACGEAQAIYPELVAPGVNIHTTDLSGFYTSQSGTSLAAPHVAGALALLLSAFPNLDANQQEAALLNGALDLGVAGPDDDFGHGRLDVLASYNWLQAGGADPTATPIATATPDPSINLALNKPVTVSSFQDAGSMGSSAADGDLSTFWQTAKASGKNKSSSEWITLDLGSSMTVGKVVLEWGTYFATNYSVLVSSDNQNWAEVFSTNNADGNNDTILFGQTQARYIRMESTAWNNSSLRIILKEIEVYLGESGTSPTATPTATSTALPPTPTITPTVTPPSGGGMSLHAGDLDGVSSPANRSRWTAAVTIRVHDADENPLAGASVSGSWSNGISGSGTCVTDVAGGCTITVTNIKSNISNVTFTIADISIGSYQYLASANHDPDGDSDGTGITIMSP